MAHETLRLKVNRMGTGGEAVGRNEASGEVVFVPHAVPGDLIEAEVFETRPRFMRARLLKVLSPGPGRVDPPCPIHFRPGGPARFCGGCDWQHLSSEAQLEAKRSIVRECLERIGRVQAEVRPTLASPEPWRYRNKVQVPFQSGPDGAPVAGFYRPWSHEVVPFEDCLVQPELSVRIVRFVVEMARRKGWAPYDEARNGGWLRHLFVRTSRDGKALAA